MNILVCVKQVPNTAEIKIDPIKGTMIRVGVPSIMNPDDKAGLEAALRLKDELGGTITVLSMGPNQAEEVLNEAYAMGADRLILLSDFKFAGSDTWATAHALAAAAKKIPFDLIITGRQAIDGDTAQVGPEMAEFLDLPQITYVRSIHFAEDRFIVERKVEDATYLLNAEGPLLVTVLAEGYTPRYMNVARLFAAYRQSKVELWTAATIDVDPLTIGLKSSPTKVYESFGKPIKPVGHVYEVDEKEAAKLIVAKLKENYLF